MALALVADEARKHPDISFEIIDPANLTLPPPGLDRGSADAASLRRRMKQAPDRLRAALQTASDRRASRRRAPSASLAR